MLGKLFKPRWQHANAEHRLRAINELAPDDPQRTQILSTLARGDSAAEVRAAAAGHITDFRFLDQLVHQDPDNRVRDAAATRINQLLAGLASDGPSLDNRLRLVRLTDNPAALAFVARHSPDSICRLAAIARTQDSALLLDLAVHGEDAAMRIAAAERLTDEDSLRLLLRDGRDKKVLQHAREQLRHYQQARDAAQARRQARSNVIAELTQHATRVPDALYAARLTQLCQQWQTVTEDADSHEQQAFDSARTRCQAVIDDLQRARDEQARLTAARSEQEAALAQLEQLQDALDIDMLPEQTGSLRALLDTQQRRWEEAVAVVEPDATRSARFQTLLDDWRQALQQLHTYQNAEDALNRLTALLQTPDDGAASNDDSSERETLAAQARALDADWPSMLPRPALLTQVMALLTPKRPPPEAAPRKASGKTARSAEQDSLDALLGALQRELRQRNLRHANRLCHKAEALLAEHPDASRAARLEKLRPQLDELRDWHAFAAEPKKQALCERMDTLCAAPLDPEEQASAIQALHDEWRSLMSSDQDSDQHLWDRFKASSDRAYEPCRAHFREQDAERQANLQKREALCDQLQTLLDNQDWDKADYPALLDIRRKAPEEFRALQPVRFTDAREAGRRFSNLLKRFSDQLQRVSDTHAAILEQLASEAEALLEQDDLRRATDEAKALQQRWKNAGWVMPQQYRGLHKRFRKACDALFNRQKELRQAQRADEVQEREAAREALTRLSGLANDHDTRHDADTLKTALRELEAVAIPRRDNALQQQRQALATQLREQLAAQPRRALVEQLLSDIDAAPDAGEACNAQRTLAVALEVSADVPSPDDAREERMRWQLEQLPKAMKQQQTPDRLKACAEHLAAQRPLLGSGLAPGIRQRLRSAVQACVR
ncbi:DUF349 domain-containing protein [Isoalcanivorax indicus]|uniref:DUF349 domain-containing protein n=1 Tax=Isoalcanivorax indicus TaxID=2202653 RepID=UPI000DB959D7|nr:DUF349 domain-containing protein [Isoalcanivorax indicus]